MSKWVIKEELCKGCGICIFRCPMKVLGVAEHLTVKGFHPAKMLNEDKCTSCAVCGRSCPDIAIEVFR
ncbi:MAG: 4Fe-4S binding protein [Candidatus Riflebacteria bacterium]|nr:4Fe-4S binding protein [Candidatus Riflebacteria bacterium]